MPSSTHWRLLAAAVLSNAAGMGTLTAQTAAPEASPVAVIHQEHDALNRHDLAGALVLYSDSVRYGELSDTATAKPSSKAALRQYLEPFFAQNPRSHVQTLHEIAVGPVVASHDRLSGTADGRVIEVLDVTEIRGGRVVYEIESGNIAGTPAEAGHDADAVVKRADNAFARGDYTAASMSFGDPVLYHAWGDSTVQHVSRAKMQEGFRHTVAANPHMHYVIVTRVRAGPFIVDHERLTGMADGKPRDALDVLEVRDGHIVAEWETPW